MTAGDMITTLATLAAIETLLARARAAITQEASSATPPKQLRLNPMVVQVIEACRRVNGMLDTPTPVSYEVPANQGASDE